MAQARLYNQSGKTIKAGDIVRLDIKNKNSIVVASLTDYGIIGTASAKILSGQFGLVNLINNINWNDIIGKPTIPVFPNLSTYQLKEIGKGLSTNDYTTEEKNKLANIENLGGYGNSYFPSGW